MVAAVAYAGLVACAGVVIAAELRRRGRALRRARGWLVAYVVGVTLLAGLTQRDLWPLSSWSLMTRAPGPDRGVAPDMYLLLVAVDSGGREYPVDYRAVEPFAIEELVAWMRKYFLDLPRAEQDSAAAYLLGRLNVARARVRSGLPPGTQGSWLGSLRAPFHTLHPRQWTAGTVPASPFAGLRVYTESWNLAERARDSTKVERTLRYAFSAVPAP